MEEINRNELMSKNHKKVCRTLNNIKDFLILAYRITGCVSISHLEITEVVIKNCNIVNNNYQQESRILH